jgi:hypothetical protein
MCSMTETMAHVQAADGEAQGEGEELIEEQATREAARKGKGPLVEEEGQGLAAQIGAGELSFPGDAENIHVSDPRDTLRILVYSSRPAPF